MFKLDLVRLRRDRTLAVAGSIPADSELWEGSELEFAGAVEVEGAASVMADGGVALRGTWKAPLLYTCGRCLEEVEVPMERSLTLIYMSGGSWDPDDPDDPDVRIIGPNALSVDLEEAIREEVLLEVPRYLLPEEDGQGRCTRCGVRREDQKKHQEPEVDPRWSALRALQND